MTKTKVAILYGGISAEHEVSIMSAKSIMENIDTEKFEVIPVLISKDGKFDEEKVKLADVVFPVLHGKGGEDGTIQKYLESIHKPYIGPDPESSLNALDKIKTKTILKNLHLPVPSFQFFSKKEWEEKPDEISSNIVPPVFIKPASTGSSIGISKVKTPDEIEKAVNVALKYDDNIIIEEALDDIREIEVAVLGNNDLKISIPGEVIPAEEFYSYDAKYRMNSKLVIPAKLSTQQNKEIKDLAKRVYRALKLRGLSRIDFFLDKFSGKIHINEANTIPGFTSISMYPKLMEKSGIAYIDLITKLILLAQEKK